MDKRSMKLLKQDYQSLSLETRRAFWLVLALAGGMLVMAVNVIPALLVSFWWAAIVTNIIPITLAVVFTLSAWLILKGRPSAGGYLFIGGLFTGMILLAASLEGLGFLLACIVFIASTYIGGLLLSKRLFTWLPVISLLVCAVIVLLDAHAPWPQDWIGSRDRRLSTWLAGAVLLLYFFFLVRQFRRFAIGTKFIYVALTLAMLPMVMIGLLGNRYAQNELKNAANQSLISSAAQIAAELDTFFFNNLDSIKAETRLGSFVDLLQTPAEDRLGSPEKHRVITDLNALRQKDPAFISSYALLDLSGVVIADTEQSQIGLHMADRAFFQGALHSGEPFITPVRYFTTDGKPSFYLSALVKDQTGQGVGVLCVRYDAQQLQQLLAFQTAETGGLFHSLIVDENHIILANSLEPETIRNSILPLNMSDLADLRARLILPQEEQVDEYEVSLPGLASGLDEIDRAPAFSGTFQVAKVWDGDPLEPKEQAGAAKMLSQPWVVVVAQPQETLFISATRLEQGIQSVGVVAALLSVFFAVTISQYLSNPVTQLTGYASRVAQGDYSTPISIRSEDEIGALANVFNQMVAQIGQLIGNLEQRVADRTKALSTSAEISRRLSTILNADQLAKTVVEQLQRTFGYYQARIYLFDDHNDTLLLKGAADQAGQAILADGQAIQKGEGPIGQAAELASPVLVNDLTQLQGWQPDPAPSEPLSELAIPLVMGDSVLGVLDVQRDSMNGFNQIDIDLLQSIATQVVIGLGNAHSYARVQHELQERQKAEESLKSQQRTLQAVLDNMPVGVVMLNASSGKIMLSNKWAIDLLGRGMEAASDVAFENEIFPQYRYGTDERYPPESMPGIAGLTGLSLVVNDVEVRQPDGSRILLQVNGAPVFHPDGRVMASVSVFQDITHAQETQELIAKRAVELAMVAEISTRISTIQNPHNMLQTVVNLTRQAFQLYHAHVYLLNEAGDTLELVVGSGEIGQQMVSEGRQIAMSAVKSLVARAARNRSGVIVNDVHQDPEFLPHRLLPNTHSEMAVPMTVGERLLGVLDIQDSKTGRFSPEDVNIMTTLAAQVAGALQNALSFTKAQRQAEQEALINTINERIQATNTVEGALQIAVREIGRALGAQRIAVRLGIDLKPDGH